MGNGAAASGTFPFVLVAQGSPEGEPSAFERHDGKRWLLDMGAEEVGRHHTEAALGGADSQGGQTIAVSQPRWLRSVRAKGRFCFDTRDSD